MEKSFENLKINEKIISGLNAMGIKEPTEIQEKIIPLALEKTNLIGQSETGTGKTLAYLLPIIENIDINKKEMQCIILAPTHELAIQINNTINEVKKASGLEITSTPLIGSANIKRQIDNLKAKPHILVGSAGRILELIRKKKVSAHTIKTIVIDEVDKLLDKNNLPTVKDIIKVTPKQTQIMMFSATLNGKTLDIAKTLAEDINVVSVKNNKVNENINHNYIKTDSRKKVETLRKLLNALKSPKVLVFNNDSYTTNTSVEYLSFNNVKVAAIGGNGKMEDRKRALENFRKGKINVLIASDIAARGLDIKGVTHVVNFDIPEDSKDYLHRAGRVGRAGESGEVFSLVDDKEENIIKMHENSFKISITERILYRGTIE
ncbi:DEAD/DEAH box helicase [Clostridium tertium]|uniref:DEAD/DEAH box helicase n=2 Tax=Clostridiaceae TaxID=31979 RepID=UPI001DB500E7|nr:MULTISPECIES: DEAD/DEAH box helicase [Clostridium]MBS5305380.1 DEAD/DEAH box helicase [Clostridium sp.]MDB1923436.1 DEAD/DEAH box helicase [Clostridium tertium]MDB1927971.1 DEAD/DEAH box helicase [Clostridium tertium]MDB1931306.1 DEAD/DEAH box helicase [Clostridium tertium]MDB1942615.1 DEAD/DEAH box helicase [Clostridium tertium]